MDQQEIQLVDVHPFDNICERFAIPFIIKRVMITFDQDYLSVQPWPNSRKIDKAAMLVIPMAEIADVQHEVVLRHNVVPQRDMLFFLFLRAFTKEAPKVRPRTEVMVTNVWLRSNMISFLVPPGNNWPPHSGRPDFGIVYQ